MPAMETCSKGNADSGSERETEKSVGSPLCERPCYCGLGCFIVCVQLRVISQSWFQMKLDTPFSFLKSYLRGKAVSVFTQWAPSQRSAAYFSWPPPPLPNLPALRWADLKSCQLGCQASKGSTWECTKARLCGTWTEMPAASRQADNWGSVFMDVSLVPSADGEVIAFVLWLH